MGRSLVASPASMFVKDLEMNHFESIVLSYVEAVAYRVHEWRKAVAYNGKRMMYRETHFRGMNGFMNLRGHAKMLQDIVRECGGATTHRDALRNAFAGYYKTHKVPDPPRSIWKDLQQSKQ